MERKGLKRFKGFEGSEPFEVCTLHERISHILSKNCHVLGRQTLFNEAEQGIIVSFACISQLCSFQKWNFNLYFGLCTNEGNQVFYNPLKGFKQSEPTEPNHRSNHLNAK